MRYRAQLLIGVRKLITKEVYRKWKRGRSLREPQAKEHSEKLCKSAFTGYRLVASKRHLNFIGHDQGCLSFGFLLMDEI